MEKEQLNRKAHALSLSLSQLWLHILNFYNASILRKMVESTENQVMFMTK